MEEKFKAHKEFYNRPILLEKEQMKNPMQVLADYFSAIELHETRSDLAKLLECALVTDNNYFGDPRQRATIVNSIQLLEEALEAAYLLSSAKSK